MSVTMPLQSSDPALDDHYSRSRPSSSNSVHSNFGHHHASLPGVAPDDLYRSPFSRTPNQQVVPGHHTRSSSNASTRSTFSLATTGITSPNDSPPTDYNSSPGVKLQNGGRHTQIRRARHEASPYARSDSFSGSESVRSSSSEAEDLSVFAFNPQADYAGLFGRGGAMANHPDPGANAAGAFQRMTLNPEQALEQLAANVRAATTTSASDRAKQIFVHAWLNANYAPYPDGNVPRQGLYNSYRRVCDEYRIPHINTATLGKAIRLCFPAIKTRRLGVRGNSKYHYCGIRPATSAEAEWLQDFIKRTTNHRVTGRPASSGRSSATDESHSDDEDDENDDPPPNSLNYLSLAGGPKSPTLYMDDKTPTVSANLAAAQGILPNHGHRGEPQIRRRTPPGGHTPVVSSNVPSHLSRGALIAPQFTTLHQSSSVRNLPNFPSIEEAIGPASSQSPHGIAARAVWGWFLDHLDGLLESVRTFRFDQFEMHLRAFWSNLSGEHREVVHAPALAGLMAKADAIVYDEILEILRSQMLSPIPAQTLTNLRQLADKMERILLDALDSYGNTFVEPKVELGARFGHLILRFLDIFQVTQALTSVLSNPKQLVDMRRSWRDIDFESVRNQAALVCNCRHEDLVQLLEVDFVTVLDGLQASREPVRDIMAWADACCDRLMGGNVGVSGEERATMSSRSLLIRWGYVTSQIMRDLTIRSDPAFGAFQILKLFTDDWIALNVLRSVALSTNSVAASVEPVIQQQFLALSPGSTQFPNGLGGHLDPSQHNGLAHTPTTSSMLSALNDSYNNHSLEGGFHNSSYDPLSFTSMDTPTSQGDHLIGSLPSNGSGGQSYHDFGSASSGGQSFDFSQDINLDPPSGGSSDSIHTPADSHADLVPEHTTPEPIKAEMSV